MSATKTPVFAACTRCGRRREIRSGRPNHPCADCTHADGDLTTMDIIEMRESGWTWQEIAEATGMSATNARKKACQWRSWGAA